MKKKEYFQPATEVITLKTTSLLADSGYSTEMLEKGVKGDPDEPELDEYRWITIE